MQSMPDVSPTKWHRAHTSWFFETFLLEPSLAGYRSFHPGLRLSLQLLLRGCRGPLSPAPARRGVAARRGGGGRVPVPCRRGHGPVCSAADPVPDGAPIWSSSGLHHEQQHQELLLMDIKHVLSCNPLQPAYATVTVAEPSTAAARLRWIEHDGGPGRDRPRRRRLRLRQRVAPPRRPPRALRPGRPGRDLRRVDGLHGRRRLRAARAVAVRRLGHVAGRRLGRPALLVPGGRRLVAVHPGRAAAGRPAPSPSAT